MLRDPEFSALLDQAARNLDTLELLARSMACEEDALTIVRLRERLRNLKMAYTRETDALTHQVLEREIERRSSGDRRAGERRPEGTPRSAS